MTPAKSIITLYLFFLTYLPFNICHGMDEWTLAAGNAMMLTYLLANWLCNIYLRVVPTYKKIQVLVSVYSSYRLLMALFLIHKLLVLLKHVEVFN